MNLECSLPWSHKFSNFLYPECDQIFQFLKVPSSLIVSLIPCHLRLVFSSDYLPSAFPVGTYPLSLSYIFRPFRPLWFGHPVNISSTVQIMKFLFVMAAYYLSKFKEKLLNLFTVKLGPAGVVFLSIYEIRGSENGIVNYGHSCEVITVCPRCRDGKKYFYMMKEFFCTLVDLSCDFCRITSQEKRSSKTLSQKCMFSGN